jgi:hypothetical protein
MRREARQQGGAAMTEVSGAAPGWYADPAQPDRWRWFDGSAWTEHVSAPVGPPAAPAYTAAPAYSGSTVMPGAQDWRSVPKPPRTTPTRILVIVVATFAGLWGLSAALAVVTGGLRAANHAPLAPGPAIHLEGSAPAVVDGLPRSSLASVQKAQETLRGGLQLSRQELPGAEAPQVAGYAVQDVGAAILGWMPDDTGIDQAAFARGVQRVMDADHWTRHVVSAEPDGATLLCAASTTSGGVPDSQCAWVRSGSGVVMLVRVGSADTDALAAVTREVVRQLSAGGT